MANDDYSALPRSAGDARAQGSKTYFTGERCKRGHLAPRYTTSFGCVACSQENSAKSFETRADYFSREDIKERARQRTREWNAKNADRKKEADRRRREAIQAQRPPKPDPAKCSAAGCDEFAHTKGMCSQHYRRWKNHGDPNWQPAPTKKALGLTCTVEGCDQPELQKGFCRAHYMRWYRHGDPLAGNASAKFRGKEGRKKYRRLHYEANKEDYLARAKAQPAEQKNKAKRGWAARNPAKVKANTIAYKQGLKRATPAWVTETDWDAMDAVYMEAKRLTIETGIPHHVDHIVPLRAKNACGLHVPNNLRVLPAVENMSRPRLYREDD